MPEQYLTEEQIEAIRNKLNEVKQSIHRYRQIVLMSKHAFKLVMIHEEQLLRTLEGFVEG